MSRIKQLGRNYQFLAINNLVAIIVSFSLFPFIVSRVGKELYGTYLLGMTINGYFGTLDLGILSALKKYVPEYRGRNDHKNLQDVINASLSFYIVFGLVAGGTLFTLSFLGPQLFKISQSNVLIMKHLFWTFAVAAVLNWPLQVFKGVVQGFQRYDWLAGLDTFIQLGYFAGTFLLLTRGFSIVSVAILFQSLLVGTGLIYFSLVRNYIENLKLKFPYFQGDTFRKIFSFSVFVFFTGLVSILIWNINDLIVGIFISVAAVAVYKVCFAMQNVIRSINGLLGSPLMTLCAEMEGASEYEKQRQLLLKGTKLMTLIVWPMIVIAILFSEVFILNWVGEEFREAIWPARILLFFWLFNISIEVGSSSLTAKGIVKPTFWITVAGACCNLTLSLILVRFWGILGVSLGISISMVLIVFPLFLFLIFKNIKVRFSEWFNSSIKRSILTSALSVLISVLVLKYFHPAGIIYVLFEMVSVYLLIICCTYFFVISRDERNEIKRMFAT